MREACSARASRSICLRFFDGLAMRTTIRVTGDTWQVTGATSGSLFADLQQDRLGFHSNAAPKRNRRVAAGFGLETYIARGLNGIRARDFVSSRLAHFAKFAAGFTFRSLQR